MVIKINFSGLEMGTLSIVVPCLTSFLFRCGLIDLKRISFPRIIFGYKLILVMYLTMKNEQDFFFCRAKG